jgi:hypothetical protein
MPRRNPALFEVIHGNARAPRPVKVPDWSGQDASEVAIESAGGPRWMSWLAEPVGLTLPRGLWALVIAAAIVLPVITYEAGRSGAGLADLSESDLRSQANVTARRDGPINRSLLASVDHRGSQPTTADSASQTTGNQPKTTGPAGRVPGMNYFCLATIPQQYRDEAERAKAFLEHNSVDAALIPVQNNRIQVIALRGFERPYSDPEAREFESLLRSLGRVWKTEHNGWSDWRDLYPIKYTP